MGLFSVFREYRARLFVAVLIGLASVAMRYVGGQQHFPGYDSIPPAPLSVQLSIGLSAPAAFLSRLLLALGWLELGKYNAYVDHLAFFLAVSLLWFWLQLWVKHLSNPMFMSPTSVWVTISLLWTAGGVLCLELHNKFLTTLDTFWAFAPRAGIYNSVVITRVLLLTLAFVWSIFLFGSATFAGIRRVRMDLMKDERYSALAASLVALSLGCLWAVQAGSFDDFDFSRQFWRLFALLLLISGAFFVALAFRSRRTASS